ncbi:MAG: GTP cyclohydrolase I FolE [Eggerthellaceae bacterium]|nr:GTP cyclohydrolase I FolE [Eggerthellaceae bacterium]
MTEFKYGEIDSARAEAAIREFLFAIGEDPDREGLLETPARVARACTEMFAGLYEDPSAHLLKQFHEADHEEMVIVRDIPFTSMCEHHLLPFTGRAHVAYIPSKGRITGLSKLARCVEGYARRPQVQERMTSQVADAIMESLEPLGTIVVVEAEHMCMTARGIKKPGSLTITSAVRGSFLNDEKTRAEVMSLFTS